MGQGRSSLAPRSSYDVDHQPALGVRASGGPAPLQPAREQSPNPPEPATAQQRYVLEVPTVVRCVARHLTHNEVLLLLLPLNRATADSLPEYRGQPVRLSQAVPPHAFAQRYGHPAALRACTYIERRQLLRLTARSGSLDNLRLLLRGQRRGPLRLPWQGRCGAAGCALGPDVLASAAAAGHLDVVRFLRTQLRCAWDASVAEAAARAGHTHVCAWLRSAGCPCPPSVLAAAASGGAPGMAEALVAGGWAWSVQAASSAAEAGHAAALQALLEVAAAAPDARPVDRAQLAISSAYGCGLELMQVSRPRRAGP
jgi:hypothetical protein